MKRNYFLAMGVVAVLLLSSCGPKRYGCNRRRCIVEKQEEIQKQKKLPNEVAFSYSDTEKTI